MEPPRDVHFVPSREAGLGRFVDLHLEQILQRHAGHLDPRVAASLHLLRASLAELAPLGRVIHVAWPAEERAAEERAAEERAAEERGRRAA